MIVCGLALGEMEGKVMKYRRLNTDFVKTDPFTGLFLAAFGVHGPEVLQLQRQMDPDDVSLLFCTACRLEQSLTTLTRMLPVFV